ncbi:MAG: hypothetical protein Q7T01_00995 [bacterium]|nr:hypothetical protein [bacterium]
MFGDVPETGSPPMMTEQEPTQTVPPVGERAGIGGIGKKLALVIGGVVLVGIIAVVLWLVFFRADPVNDVLPIPQDTQQPAPTPTPEPQPDVAPAPVSPSEPDADGDGLTDVEEEQIGTDPQLSDSDRDSLTDFDEVRTYRTDPLNADTDDDSYLDGDEVRNGFDPKGPGALFEVPPVL